MKKKIYYEHDIHTGTSIGLEYEKYLYQSQSKYQNILLVDNTFYYILCSDSSECRNNTFKH